MKSGIYINQAPFTMRYASLLELTASYNTTIPRQVGLSGSSSIIIAALRALMDYYSIPVFLAISVHA